MSLLFILCAAGLIGCGKAKQEENVYDILQEAADGGEPGEAPAGQELTAEDPPAGQELTAEEPPGQEDTAEAPSGQELTAEDPPAQEPTVEAPQEETPAAEAPQIDENGSYTTKEDVALYLHVYGRLPSNFMTKKEARKLGWDGGSLEDYAPGMCIGGDYYGNREGLLPDGKYHECDIDTLGAKKRGAKRIVYSDDGRIYYTSDHYGSFEQLY
ncbi:MAG: ribonuclease [Lachnospiraceae bacterium]|nr:ribonuclease [Lachnospiraceae bacterium]